MKERKKGEVEPRKAFWEDLVKAVCEWRKKKMECLICLDANDVMGSKEGGWIN